jgi:molybdopterin converting factor small subunit
MAVLFVIPGPLRELAGNRTDVAVDGAAGSVRDALARLWAECPGIRDRVLTERDEVRPHVNIFVDGENIRFAGGLDAPVRDGAEVILLPAISGG